MPNTSPNIPPDVAAGVAQRLPLPIHGRGAVENPPNRFERIVLEPEGETLDADALEAGGAETRAEPTQYFKDSSRGIIAFNDSPDLGFDASINPYRGCEHGCIYCYARPYHEYLGLSAGLDFESRIFVKLDAPELLRRELSAKLWQPQVIALSGVTDAYQPIERRLKITRRLLEVLREFRNPVTILTKNHCVTRDIDILSELAALGAASVSLSITTLDPHLTGLMEPRTSSPARRLTAIEALAKAGIPVGVLAGPMIPGLSDHELPNIVKAAADAGATWASFIPIRLPGAVEGLFIAWLERHFPDRKQKVLDRIRSVRGGRLNDGRTGHRFTGQGIFYDQMHSMFELACKRAGLTGSWPSLSTAAFRPPNDGQMNLWGSGLVTMESVTRQRDHFDRPR
jgi:DNA repair photolyase